VEHFHPGCGSFGKCLNNADLHDRGSVRTNSLSSSRTIWIDFSAC
jgi:hypothetical protein